MQCNIYGLRDNCFLLNSNVIPTLITYFHYVKAIKLLEVIIWSIGKLKKQSLYVDDYLRALICSKDLENKRYKKLLKDSLNQRNLVKGKSL